MDFKDRYLNKRYIELTKEARRLSDERGKCLVDALMPQKWKNAYGITERHCSLANYLSGYLTGCLLDVSKIIRHEFSGFRRLPFDQKSNRIVISRSHISKKLTIGANTVFVYLNGEKVDSREIYHSGGSVSRIACVAQALAFKAKYNRKGIDLPIQNNLTETGFNWCAIYDC